MARLLALAGKHVTVSLMQGGVSSDLASQNLAALPNNVVVQAPAVALLLNHDCVIDAVFGIGFDGELSEDLQAVFHALASRPCLRVALDIPVASMPTAATLPPIRFKPMCVMRFTA